VQAWWKRCVDAGDIYLGEYEGWYCVADEAYYTEKELVDGKAPSGRPVERVREQSYFFRLSKYADALIKLYESEPQRVMPEGRRNEVLSFLREGLRDLSLSRTTFTWGIPVPGDPKHVIYVWFDALFNYLTALGGPGASWPSSSGPRTCTLIGKDILRFHAVYWPAFLLSAGLPPEQLPRTIWSHGFLLNGGRKVSKTRVEGEDEGPRQRFTPGTTDPTRLVDSLGADVLRYHLLREVAFGQDGDFNVPSIVSRARSDLAETVGNLLNRTLPFVVKHFDGRVPRTPESSAHDALDQALRARAAELAQTAGAAWDNLQFHVGLGAAVDLARAGNKYFDESAPWKLAKAGDTDRLAAVIANVLELLRQVAVMLWPAAPAKSDEIRAQLGLDALTPLHGADLWPQAWGGLAAHTAVAPGAPVFPKYDAVLEAQIYRDLDVVDLGAAPAKGPTEKKIVDTKTDEKKTDETKPDAPPAPIEYADFERVDLRLGKVLTAERIPKKDKLLKLSVDLGEATGPRTIIAGIALAYAPEALVGKQVTVVANLQPRSFGGGLTSHGMLLACGPSDGLSLATFEKEHAPGTRVK
jgi:methionyl-tRNA synthetase